MKIEINISDKVIELLNDLGIKESDHENVIVDFINDKLDLDYMDGMYYSLFRWAQKKDNIETYLNK
jgi:hypothetical protein